MSAVWDEGDERTKKAYSHFLQGLFYAWEGRYEEAVEALRGAIETDAEMVGPYVEMGKIYACLGRYREAVDVLRRAMGVGPSALRAYLGKGRQLGEREHHLASVEGAMETASRLVSIGASYIASGRDREAAGMLEMAVQIDQGNAPAVTLLATAYLLMGEAAAEAGRKSALRSIPELESELFGD